MSETLNLSNPYMKDIGPSLDRVAQPVERARLPQGTRLVSTDAHWEIVEDIFIEAFPASLKDKAPRVWFDKFWRIGVPGQEIIKEGESAQRAAVRSFTPGIGDMEVRQKHLRIEGVEMEIVYPQSLLFFAGFPDREVREQVFRAYNHYIAKVSRENPGFHGVGVFSNWWDPAQAESAMQQIVDLGLKTFMIPVKPGTDVDGKAIVYGDVPMDRFWSVANEAGLPVGFHVSESFDPGPRGGLAAAVATTFGTFRKPLAEIIFGGVFDRHPDLKVVFAEGGISWVPVALQDFEMVYDSYGSGDLLDPIKHRPSHYWQNNCYATFQTDLLGLRMLDDIGVDTVMWSNDYPHCEGTFGFTPSSVQSVMEATTPENARKILGGTAIELYGLD